MLKLNILLIKPQKHVDYIEFKKITMLALVDFLECIIGLFGIQTHNSATT